MNMLLAHTQLKSNSILYSYADLKNERDAEILDVNETCSWLLSEKQHI